jgi:hypothetical protein
MTSKFSEQIEVSNRFGTRTLIDKFYSQFRMHFHVFHVAFSLGVLFLIWPEIHLRLTALLRRFVMIDAWNRLRMRLAVSWWLLFITYLLTSTARRKPASSVISDCLYFTSQYSPECYIGPVLLIVCCFIFAIQSVLTKC